MSKKTLLNEAQVRKFMKLACLEPLAAGFVHGLNERAVDESHGSGKTELNQTDDGMGRRTNRAGQLSEEEGLDDMALDAEEDASDMDQDLDDLEDVAVADEEVAGDEGRMIAVDDFLSALETALESAMGDEVEIDASDMSDDSEHDEHEEENAEHDMEHAADLEDDADEDMGDIMGEDKAYTAKKEKPGADKRKGAEKRGAEGTLAKTKGHGRVDYVNEDEAYTSKREKPGADKRKGAMKRGAEATKLKHDEPGGRGHKKGDDAYVNEEQGADDREDEHLGMEDGKESGKKQSMKDRRKEMRGARRAAGEAGDPVPHQESLRATDDLVEAVTKRVAARILKSALAKR